MVVVNCLRQEINKSEVSLEYITRSCLNKEGREGGKARRRKTVKTGSHTGWNWIKTNS